MKSFDELELGLEKGALVLLDSSPLIYHVEGGTAARAAVLGYFLDAAKEGKIRLAASTLLWTEVLTRPQAGKDRAVADRYRQILSDSRSLVLAPVDVAIAEAAAGLLCRRAGRLELADAIHLATATTLGAAAILTNDEAWKEMLGDEKKDPGLARILLVDELAWKLS